MSAASAPQTEADYLFSFLSVCVEQAFCYYIVEAYRSILIDPVLATRRRHDLWGAMVRCPMMTHAGLLLFAACCCSACLFIARVLRRTATTFRLNAHTHHWSCLLLISASDFASHGRRNTRQFTQYRSLPGHMLFIYATTQAFLLCEIQQFFDRRRRQPVINMYQN